MYHTQQSSITEMYISEIAKNPLLPREQTHKLAQRFGWGDLQARHDLIVSNLRLVINIAKKYRMQDASLTLLDLTQEGNMGLLKAVENYKWWIGVQFNTFATHCIHRSIKRALSDKSRMVRLPDIMVKRIWKYKKAKAKLKTMLGREPLIEEIASQMGLPILQVSRVKAAITDAISLDVPIKKYESGDSEERPIGYFIEEEETEPPSIQESKILSLKKALKSALQKLTPRDQKIVSIRYGLEDGVPHIHKEIAEEFGITKAAIGQVCKRALKKLREDERLANCF